MIHALCSISVISGLSPANSFVYSFNFGRYGNKIFYEYGLYVKDMRPQISWVLQNTDDATFAISPSSFDDRHPVRCCGSCVVDIRIVCATFLDDLEIVAAIRSYSFQEPRACPDNADALLREEDAAVGSRRGRS
jgi:hypothetical protein